MSISTKPEASNLSLDRVSLLRSLLKLPLDKRNILLAEHSAILCQDFTPESDEMEWVEEYRENENWETDE